MAQRKCPMATVMDLLLSDQTTSTVTTNAA
jgi:hypothetical protein